MIIPIDSRYRLVADERQWTIQRNAGISKATGLINWTPIGYYTTIQAAVSALAQREIMTADTTTLVKAIDRAAEVGKWLQKALSPVVKVNIEEMKNDRV